MKLHIRQPLRVHQRVHEDFPVAKYGTFAHSKSTLIILILCLKIFRRVVLQTSRDEHIVLKRIRVPFWFLIKRVQHVILAFDARARDFLPTLHRFRNHERFFLQRRTLASNHFKEERRFPGGDVPFHAQRQASVFLVYKRVFRARYWMMTIVVLVVVVVVTAIITAMKITRTKLAPLDPRVPLFRHSSQLSGRLVRADKLVSVPRHPRRRHRVRRGGGGIEGGGHRMMHRRIRRR